MDEPTTDLDPEGREEVQAIARRLREQGRTLLIVDYEPETGENADQVWLMREGRLVARGAPREILADIPTLKSCGIKVPRLSNCSAEMGWPGKTSDRERSDCFDRKARPGQNPEIQAPGSTNRQHGGSCHSEG